MAIDLSKQQALDFDPRAIQQINFTEYLDRKESTTIFSLLKKQKKPFWIFHKNHKSILNLQKTKEYGS